MTRPRHQRPRHEPRPMRGAVLTAVALLLIAMSRRPIRKATPAGQPSQPARPSRPESRNRKVWPSWCLLMVASFSSGLAWTLYSDANGAPVGYRQLTDLQGGIGLVVDRPVSEARLGVQQMAPSGLVWIVLKVRSDSPEPFRWRLLGFGTELLRQTESQGGSVQLTKPETVRTLGIAFSGGRDGFLAAEIQKFGGVELDAPVQVLLDGEAQPEKAANGSLALDGGTYRADAISATAGRMVGGTPTLIGQVHTAGGGTVLLFDDRRDVHWIAPDPVLVSADLVLDPDYEFTSSSPQAINPSASFPFNVFQSWREQSPPTLDASTVRWTASDENLAPRWKAQSERLLAHAQSSTFVAGVLLGLAGGCLVAAFQLLVPQPRRS